MTKTRLTLAVLALVLATQFFYRYGTEDWVTATVTDKERITNQEESFYLIYTDSEVFTNVDSLWHLKFSSSDLQGKLRRGTSYRLRVYGWRVPLFSWYRNVVAAEPATLDDDNNEKRESL